MIPDIKRCPRCNITKPKEEYYTKMDKGNKVLQGYCVSCERERRREKYWENPQKERTRSKRRMLRNGRNITPEQDRVHNIRKKERALVLRKARLELIIKLCMEAYEVDNREWLNGRYLLGKYEECATMSVWLIRKHTFLSREAIAEIFNCSSQDIIDRIKLAVHENSWERGDILFRMKRENILKKYQRNKPTIWSKVDSIPYDSFSEAMRQSKNILPYNPPNSPSTGITQDQLIETLSWYYNISSDIFYSDDTHIRGREAMARQVYMYLLYAFMGLNEHAQAQLFSRDRSTVMSNIKKGKEYMKKDRNSLFFELAKRYPEAQTCPAEQMIS